jgi:hypothetical protein
MNKTDPLQIFPPIKKKGILHINHMRVSIFLNQ